MKSLCSLILFFGSLAHAATTKTCLQIGGNNPEKIGSISVELSKGDVFLGHSTSMNVANGKFVFTSTVSTKSGATYRKYVKQTDGEFEAVLEPKLLKAGSTGTLKIWYNNGDGFISTVFRCSDK